MAIVCNMTSWQSLHYRPVSLHTMQNHSSASQVSTDHNHTGFPRGAHAAEPNEIQLPLLINAIVRFAINYNNSLASRW